uniref:Uncharacterized protein n=1 Tax=Corethron hystrix TaxID=216773 RepID=A0A7S1FTP2_9STRA
MPGRWVLCYLRPGPNGEGIDRRLPFFPENLPFNESYQMFTFDREGGRVTNIGQLLGPFLRIEVSGGLARVLTPENDGRSPRRFRAEINGGGLCVGKEKNEEKSTSKCLPLPIKGEGLFDGLYVGERLRIGRNINGGGAVVVQIRVG